MKINVSFSIIALALILGLGTFYLSVLETQKVPAWIFALGVPLNETLARLDLIHIKEQDIDRFHGLVEALNESDPFKPVKIPNRMGKKIINFLGGEDTAVKRAYVKDIVYCYSMEIEGNYYNVCIIFLEDRNRAMVSGAYWVGGVK